MVKVEFNFDKLSEKEKSLYLGMNEKERATYEKAWIGMETQREKLKTQAARVKKLESAHNEKARKERTHHLIEVGAIVEKSVHISNLERWEEYIKKYSHAIEKFCNEEPEKPSELDFLERDPDPILPEPVLDREELDPPETNYKFYNPNY